MCMNVHMKNPKTINELQGYIHDAFKDDDDNRNLCRTLYRNVLDRCEACVDVGEGHFERLRDYTVSV